MKQNNHNRQAKRFNNRPNRPNQVIYRNTALDSSGPAGKLRGTALQLFEKYSSLAKDAATQNDAILAEQYHQYADHYMRMQNLAIENETALRAAKEAQNAATTDAVEESPATTEGEDSAVIEPIKNDTTISDENLSASQTDSTETLSDTDKEI